MLFIDLHLGIWPHARLDLQVIEGLIGIGSDVSVLTCQKTMNWHCAVNESYGRQFEFDVQRLDCKKCGVSEDILSESILKSERLRIVDTKELEHQTSQDFRRQKEALLESRKSDKPYVSTSGCEITKFASYEMYLKYKLHSDQIVGPRERRFQLAFELNALKFHLIGERLAKQQHFDYVYVYSPQYSANHSVLWAFERLGTPVYFVEGSSALSERYSHVRMWDWTKYGLSNPNLVLETTAPRQQVTKTRVDAHFNVIRRGSSFSVYSPREKRRRSPIAQLGLDREKPTALLVVSSSDELLAARAIDRFPPDHRMMKVYESQVDWVRDTIEWFRTKPDVQLVVRPHPRDFPTNREPEIAAHTSDYLDIFSNLPNNVKVDGPADPEPLWSYFREVDVLVTGWSSTALEAIYNNIPVITFDSGATSFPSRLSFTGETRDDYIFNLQRFENGALTLSKDAKNHFWAWMEVNYFASTLALSGRLLERARVRWNLLNRTLNFLDLIAPKLYRRVDMKMRKGRTSPDHFRDFLKNNNFGVNS